jgi:hypothetical protein
MSEASDVATGVNNVTHLLTPAQTCCTHCNTHSQTKCHITSNPLLLPYPGPGSMEVYHAHLAHTVQQLINIQGFIPFPSQVAVPKGIFSSHQKLRILNI